MEGPSLEKRTNNEGPYRKSTLVEKVRQSKRIAFLDVDSTLTVNPDIAHRIRERLEEQGCAVVFVTSRTEEMQMSEEDLRATDPQELKRPPPHLRKTAEGSYEYADPKTLPEHSPFVEGDAIAGTTGTRLFIKQESGGYKLDTEFEESMVQESATWRDGVFELLEYVDPEHTVTIAPIDVAENFEHNQVDVYPPNYRVQLGFSAKERPHETAGSTGKRSVVSEESGKQLLVQKNLFTEKIDDVKNDPNTPAHIREIVSNVRITDDSNPMKGMYQLYITPHQGYKARAVEHIIKNIVSETGIYRNDLKVIIAGDSYPDVAMGLYGALSTEATFVVAGGSRLSAVFTEPQIHEFAAEEFTAIKKRLSGDFEKGILEFKQPMHGSRKIIIGDKVFPGMKAPESILAALDTIFEKE